MSGLPESSEDPAAPPDDGGDFRGRSLRWVVGIGVGSFALYLALLVFGDVLFETRSNGADSFSRSALGHRALVEWLQVEGVDVDVLRASPLEQVADDDLLLVLEPQPPDEALPGALDLTPLREREGPVLVTLPAWAPVHDPDRPRWVGGVVPADGAEEVVRALGFDARTVRVEAPRLPTNALGVSPDLARPQLLIPPPSDRGPRIDGLETVVGGPDGVLLARAGDLWILSDPDVLANHGLARDGTARFALALLDRVRGERPVKVDETCHGFVLTGSLWRELFAYPLVLLLAQALLVAGCVVWRGMIRSGDARPLAPPLPPGKETLIRNTASLMELARRDSESAARYLRIVFTDVARRHRLPMAADPESSLAALQALSRRRGATLDPADLVHEARHVRATPHRLFAFARRLDRWRQEILDGPGVHPNARR